MTPGARLVDVDTDHCNDQATVCCWHHKYGTCLLTLQSTLRQPAPHLGPDRATLLDINYRKMPFQRLEFMRQKQNDKQNFILNLIFVG